MSAQHRPAIAIIGGGPRGVSLVERIGANLSAALPTDDLPGGGLDIHVVDDTQIGAGRVWRTDQPRELCMNTLAGAVTLFTDDSVVMSGPVVPGPALDEWCSLVLDEAYPTPATAARVARIPGARVAAFREAPVPAGLADRYRSELEAQRPESHPSRALFGEYGRWCFSRAVRVLPSGVDVHEHLARAVSVVERDGRQVIGLSTGAEIVADSVIAAPGWLPHAPTAEERSLAAAVATHPGLVWIAPDSPVDQDLDSVPDGADAIVRGLGMGFFDAMALLTIGRGGRFVEDTTAAGGLRYEPSGREPILHVTSHRGVPYRAKTLYGSLPPRAAQRYLRSLDTAALPHPIDFDARLWPLILKDGFVDYYETLHRVRPEALPGGLGPVLAAIDTAPGSVAELEHAVAPLVPDPADRFDLSAAMSPAGREFDSPADYDDWVRRYVADDLREAERGRDSPLKAGLWSIASARGPVGGIGSFGTFDAESRRSGFRTLTAFGGMVGSGPPAFRNRQLLALSEVGLAHFIGPAASVRLEGDAFGAASPFVPGSEVRARVLIDAWMQFHDAADSADPLVRSLDESGRTRPFRIQSRAGGDIATAGFDIDPSTGLLVHPDGSIDPAIHMGGIPIDDVLHDAIISPMPGANATMLRETDRLARSALLIAASATATTVTTTTDGVSRV